MPLPRHLEKILNQDYGNTKIGGGRENYLDTLTFEEVLKLLEACRSYNSLQEQRKSPNLR